MVSISVAELKTKLATDPTTRVIDVRTPKEFNSGAIAGAINIPTHQVQQRLEEFKSDQPTYIICHSGTRSRLVTLALGAMGVANLYNVTGGMAAWEQQAHGL